MPPSSNPSVYVDDSQRGVKTISGVSTSVTAFVGCARRGPANRATRVSSITDFHRCFGGLNSELSFAIHRFFLNGGTEAWVVRVGSNFKESSRVLTDAGGADSLIVSALDPGEAGN